MLGYNIDNDDGRDRSHRTSAATAAGAVIVATGIASMLAARVLTAIAR